MSKTIKEYIEQFVSNGYTLAQARNLTSQLIILSKIEKSKFADKVLLKGGVVMYNLTHEQRRTTSDLDFDFVRYGISKDSDIELFVKVLNKKEPQFKVTLNGKIEELHQQDYHGKRAKLSISDATETLRFKLDIGVHTLLAIDQKTMCFSFDNEKSISLLVNPPEQMLAEKLFSLAKIGPASVRFKDVDDMYYLISKKTIDINKVRECLNLLTINPVNGISDMQDVINKAVETLESKLFTEGYLNSGGSWLGMNYNLLKESIIEFLYKL